MAVHVVSKTDNRQHATFQLSEQQKPLQPSSVRVRASLITLSSNNLSYALGGTRLHWWDTYPVPATAPAPYNDNSAWGIVPAWGLATVIESTIPGIDPGTTLYGYWPTSQHAVDLQLAAGEVPGHWRETSAHRTALMPLYNRYDILDISGRDSESLGWEDGIKPVLLAGYVLSQYVFTPDAKLNPPVHPFGGTEGWDSSTADLSKSVFVSLSASTKTARSLAYYFYCRPAGSGPLRFLQVTSSPAAIAEAADKFLPQFPVKAIGYDEVESVGAWLNDAEAKRIIIADFGARDGALDGLRGVIENSDSSKGVTVTILQIGNQQKVYTPGESQAAQMEVVALGKVRTNTSAIQETAIELQGATPYFADYNKRWKQWLEHRECAAPDLKLVWGEGVVGDNGVEGAWERLGQGQVRPEEVLVYRLFNERNGRL
ncbi:hypothetical protein ASPCAL05153 [Aspergillus calidoustus]|uniref:Uncharacterized protein n=1 Tax=Aspergillus calidoustus TaxID=454130 RepID=A0A0U5FXF1_ASPCI|nr:hypothetical protein ASPCAL05153 [Aspergillus calidoustus]